jgi:hypothetical protein
MLSRMPRNISSRRQSVACGPINSAIRLVNVDSFGIPKPTPVSGLDIEARNPLIPTRRWYSEFARYTYTGGAECWADENVGLDWH